MPAYSLGGCSSREIASAGIALLLEVSWLDLSPLCTLATLQNPYLERLIASIRNQCLDHMIVFTERHLHRTLNAYFDHYHRSRIHQSLDMNCPEHRPVEEPPSDRL